MRILQRQAKKLHKNCEKNVCQRQIFESLACKYVTASPVTVQWGKRFANFLERGNGQSPSDIIPGQNYPPAGHTMGGSCPTCCKTCCLFYNLLRTCCWLSICCGLSYSLLYNKLYNKSTTSRSNGVRH